MQLEEDLMRARVSRKWYLVVIVLLYIGLLASFSLNVTLLMRKPVSPLSTPETHQGYGHGQSTYIVTNNLYKCFVCRFPQRHHAHC